MKWVPFWEKENTSTTQSGYKVSLQQSKIVSLGVQACWIHPTHVHAVYLSLDSLAMGNIYPVLHHGTSYECLATHECMLLTFSNMSFRTSHQRNFRKYMVSHYSKMWLSEVLLYGLSKMTPFFENSPYSRLVFLLGVGFLPWLLLCCGSHSWPFVTLPVVALIFLKEKKVNFFKIYIFIFILNFF
jgi:hypothetical protein